MASSDLGAAPVGDWPAGWADLPVGVLSLLASDHLPCVRDRLAMAAVCRPWRSSVSVSDLQGSPLPSILLPSPRSRPSFLCLLGGVHHHPVPSLLHDELPRYISSAGQGGWLLVASQSRSYRLFNFWSGALIVLPCFILYTFRGREFVRISAASIAPQPPALGAETSGVMVAAIMDGGARLGFWPVRSYRERCFWAPGLEGRQLEDVIFFDGSFFVLTRQEGIFEFVLIPDPELQDLRLLPPQEHLFCPRIPQPGLALPPEAVVARFLVESRGELLMVVQIASAAVPGEPRETTGFQIFGARAPACDGILHRWVAQDLGQRLLLLGRGCSRCFDTSDAGMGVTPGFYFLDGSDFYQPRPKSYSCQDMGFCSPDGSVVWIFPRQENCPLSPAVWAFPFPAPVTRLVQNDKERLAGMAGRLQSRLVGQSDAVKMIAGALLMPRAGVGRSQQPTGSFLFVGPTGVGKTELAKALAEQLFDDETLLVRIDMSEYTEQHSIGRLFGAPTGHGGELTENVRRRPYCVILIDQVEKAHPAVLDGLLPLLEDGILTDEQGRMINFRHTVVILASNLGAQNLHAGMAGKFSMTIARDLVMREVKRRFRPELLNLLDEVVVFDPLSRNQLREVARLQIKDLAAPLAERGVALAVTDAALNLIMSLTYDPVYGAEPIRRWIEKRVLSQMPKIEEIDGECTVYIDATNKRELAYRVEKRVD